LSRHSLGDGGSEQLEAGGSKGFTPCVWNPKAFTGHRSGGVHTNHLGGYGAQPHEGFGYGLMSKT